MGGIERQAKSQIIVMTQLSINRLTAYNSIPLDSPSATLNYVTQ